MINKTEKFLIGLVVSWSVICFTMFYLIQASLFYTIVLNIILIVSTFFNTIIFSGLGGVYKVKEFIYCYVLVIFMTVNLTIGFSDKRYFPVIMAEFYYSFNIEESFNKQMDVFVESSNMKELKEMSFRLDNRYWNISNVLNTKIKSEINKREKNERKDSK